MSGCDGCTRRALLQGLGLLTLSAGCKIDLDQAPPDGPLPDSNVPPEPPVPCEPGKFCVDLARPSSDPLRTVGGFLVVITDTGLKILIVRTDETTYNVTSAVCTHKGCTVGWNGTLIRCPCHASYFHLDGTVQRGPASEPLRVYEASLDAASNILTITL